MISAFGTTGVTSGFNVAASRMRNSVRASKGFAHLVIVDNNWVVEFYAGGFLTPLTDIDPGFRLDAGVNTYDDTIYWDEAARTFSAKSVSFSMNGLSRRAASRRRSLRARSWFPTTWSASRWSTSLA